MNKKIIALICLVGLVIISSVVVVILSLDNENINNIEKKIQITMSVFDKENNNIYKEEIKTNEKYLIEVLKDMEELKVITEDSDYGEYITSIMDIEQGDNYYWSYYIDDEYATVGASSCEIEDGKTYSFKIEKMEY